MLLYMLDVDRILENSRFLAGCKAAVEPPTTQVVMV